MYYAEKIVAKTDPDTKIKHFHAYKVTRIAKNFSGDIVVIEAKLPSDDEQIRDSESNIEGQSDDQ